MIRVYSLFLSLFLTVVLITFTGCSTEVDSESLFQDSGDGHAKVYEQIKNILEIAATKNTLDINEITRLFLDARYHVVTNPDLTDKYDPKGRIGFCYGRAMTVHLLARQRGLREDSIRKLFFVGNLKQTATRDTEWRFHVTTVVKDSSGIWWAVDPIFNRAMVAGEWIAQVRNIWDSWYKTSPTATWRAKMYLTQSQAVLPDVRFLPEPETGNQLIDLSFAPEKHQISASSELKKSLKIPAGYGDVYALDLNQTETYFLTTSEPEENRFDFEKLAINFGTQVEVYEYNHYFIDLLNALSKNVAPKVPPTAQAANARTTEKSVDKTKLDFEYLGLSLKHKK